MCYADREPLGGSQDSDAAGSKAAVVDGDFAMAYFLNLATQTLPLLQGSDLGAAQAAQLHLLLR